MKTAEGYEKEWEVITNHWIASECWSHEDFVEAHTAFIQRIMLDAMKEGARMAAEVCKGNADWMPADNDECHDAILTTAEQWTEKDL